MGECGECGHRDDVGAENRQLLWDEYKHRHNLVWRIVFQVTLAVVFLSIVPYLAPDPVRDALGQWLLAAPVLALVLVLFSLPVMSNELRLLRLITKAHRREQQTLFKIKHGAEDKGACCIAIEPQGWRYMVMWLRGKNQSLFDKLMGLYFLVLLLVGLVNFIVSLIFLA
jgi:hypothetical protein